MSGTFSLKSSTPSGDGLLVALDKRESFILPENMMHLSQTNWQYKWAHVKNQSASDTPENNQRGPSSLWSRYLSSCNGSSTLRTPRRTEGGGRRNGTPLSDVASHNLTAKGVYCLLERYWENQKTSVHFQGLTQALACFLSTLSCTLLGSTAQSGWEGLSGPLHRISDQKNKEDRKDRKKKGEREEDREREREGR